MMEGLALLVMIMIKMQTIEGCQEESTAYRGASRPEVGTKSAFCKKNLKFLKIFVSGFCNIYLSKMCKYLLSVFHCLIHLR